MTSTSFTLLLGGSLTVTDRLRALTHGSRVIAADSGMRHAANLGVTPELWVGDFDSSDADLIARFPTVERRTYPAAKAVTDGEIAVAEAIDLDVSAPVITMSPAFRCPPSPFNSASLLARKASGAPGWPITSFAGADWAKPSTSIESVRLAKST